MVRDHVMCHVREHVTVSCDYGKRPCVCHVTVDQNTYMGPVKKKRMWDHAMVTGL